jgi:16S rRNA (cytosine1402-N4)-methyltransferase
MTSYHEPVMVRECLEGLAIIPAGIYVDVTFGGGGHSREILKQLGSEGKLVAFDQDADAEKNTINDPRFELIQDNFRNMEQHLMQKGLLPVNGILADLGVSSHQFDTSERGFTIRFDHDLDMRMDTRSGITAREVLATYSEKELTQLFSQFGEVRNARSVARAICKIRESEPVITSSQLQNAIMHLAPFRQEQSWLAQIYQALRIEVNTELDVLKEFLSQSNKCLAAGGRLVVMSYHSLEDRLVKNYIAKGNFEGISESDVYGNPVGRKFTAITRKPVTPSPTEIESNPRSRSARLRVAEKLNMQ